MTVGRRRAALAGCLLLLLLAGLAFREQIADPPRQAAGPEALNGSPTSSRAGSKAEAETRAATATASAAAPVQRRTLRLHDEAGRPVRARIKVMMSWDSFKTFQILEVDGDDGGQAELALDPAAWILLDVRAPGHRGQLRSPVTWRDLPDEPVEFGLEAAAPVELRPLSIKGEPLPDLKVRLSPEWPSGDFTGLTATKMGIVDEELRTDPQGRVTATSLRGAPYLLTFPDHPQWPAIRISAEELARSPLSVRLPWTTGP